MDLPTFLAQPAPRSGGQAFLAPAQARDRTSLKVVAALFALPVAVVLGAVVSAGAGAETLLIALGTLALLALLIGLPAWLYMRQDATLGPRLLRDGVVVPAQVRAGGADATGGTLLEVVTAGEASPRVLRFRVPLSHDAARSLVGSAVSLVALLGSPESVGLVLDGHGLVTTR